MSPSSWSRKASAHVRTVRGEVVVDPGRTAVVASRPSAVAARSSVMESPTCSASGGISSVQLSLKQRNTDDDGVSHMSEMRGVGTRRTKPTAY